MAKDKKQFDFNEIWKHRFWIACGLIALMCIVTFVISIRSLENERSARASQIQQKARAIQNVLSTGVEDIEDVLVHPNEFTERGMLEEVEAGAEANLQAWAKRYEEQQPYLQWPEEIPESLRRTLSTQKQPEVIEETGWRLDKARRDTFRENIVRVMPKLAARIGAVWKYDDRQNNSPTQDGAIPLTDMVPEKGIVHWNDENQEIWNTKVTQFEGRHGNNDTVPNELQIFALQQDLWILGAVFDIIKKVNGDVTANDLAKIKRIDHILIGSNTGSFESVGSVHAASQVLGGQAQQQQRDQGQRQPTQLQAPGMGGPPAPAPRPDAPAAGTDGRFNPGASTSPFHGRYIDREFERINKSELIQALTADSLMDKSYLQVARRIPVRLAVRMDERRIAEFLAAAANSPFIFEIQRVRINEHEPNEGYQPDAATQRRARSGDDGDRQLMMGGGGEGAAQADDPGARGGRGARGRGGAGAGDDRAAQLESLPTEQRINFDVDVEFYGVIRLYNEVREELLLGPSPGTPGGISGDTATAAARREPSG